MTTATATSVKREDLRPEPFLGIGTLVEISKDGFGPRWLAEENLETGNLPFSEVVDSTVLSRVPALGRHYDVVRTGSQTSHFEIWYMLNADFSDFSQCFAEKESYPPSGIFFPGSSVLVQGVSNLSKNSTIPKCEALNCILTQLLFEESDPQLLTSIVSNEGSDDTLCGQVLDLLILESLYSGVSEERFLDALIRFNIPDKFSSEKLVEKYLDGEFSDGSPFNVSTQEKELRRDKLLLAALERLGKDPLDTPILTSPQETIRITDLTSPEVRVGFTTRDSRYGSDLDDSQNSKVLAELSVEDQRKKLPILNLNEIIEESPLPFSVIISSESSFESPVLTQQSDRVTPKGYRHIIWIGNILVSSPEDLQAFSLIEPEECLLEVRFHSKTVNDNHEIPSYRITLTTSNSDMFEMCEFGKHKDTELHYQIDIHQSEEHRAFRKDSLERVWIMSKLGATGLIPAFGRLPRDIFQAIIHFDYVPRGMDPAVDDLIWS